jgi:hypothetical protein
MRSKHSGGYWVEQGEKREAKGLHGTGKTNKPNTVEDTSSIGEKWMRLLGGYGQRGKQIDREVKKATK